MTLQTAKIDNIFRHVDPIIAAILEKSLSEKEVSAEEATKLFDADGIDFQLIGLVADNLRKKRCGDTVTYVINRNINFTNVCVKQCGFCAFSRDFREEEGYFLPIKEIVARAKEAHNLGATEVCIQAGIPPNLERNFYQKICMKIKSEIPDIHIHGFSPEEIIHGASNSNVSPREFLSLLKESGVDTIPGTSAEILDQRIRDKISPGRISVKNWVDIIKMAHKMGIKSTSTIMFGHIETPTDITNHIALLREIQKETHGFTEFVPLNFIHTEAPMFTHNLFGGIKNGANSKETLLMHAVARIMLNGFIDNIQMSWVKEGARMAQLLLTWGANDFGGTLINESISTAAGSENGQLLRPNQIRQLVRQIGRIPAERNTTYDIIQSFEKEPKELKKIDGIKDSKFGTYFDLIKNEKFRFKKSK